MKKLLFCLLLLSYGLLSAQEAYILTTTGDTIAIDPGEHFYDTGRKIKYYSGNAIFPKTIKTEEVYEIVDGASVYKVYAFDEKKHLYKIVVTSSDKKLLVRFIEPAANASSGGLGIEYYIVDENFSVLASGAVSPASSKKKAEQEKQAIRHILEHFCPIVIQSLGTGVTTQPDGTEKPFDDNIALGFKVQKGILQCD